MTRRIGHRLIACIACLVAAAAESGESVVLVTAETCPVENIRWLPPEGGEGPRFKQL